MTSKSRVPKDPSSSLAIAPLHLNSLEPLLNISGLEIEMEFLLILSLPLTESALNPALYNFLKSRLVTFSKESVTLNILISL